MEPELIADYACVTGENPLWHPLEERLYWCDIPTGRLFRFDPGNGSHEQFYRGDVVGGFTIQVDGSLLLFMERGAVRMWRDGEIKTVIEEIAEERDSRFNDVIADPVGRVFCGTMPTRNHPATLYRLDPDRSIHRVLEGIGVSNGMGFTPDGKGIYHTDSTKREIHLYEYDEGSGELGSGTLFVKASEGEGGPDGMTVDSQGRVWSAIWDGSRLVRYARDGREEMRIPFPARKVSSVAFGGKGYEEIYVTTAGGDKRSTEGLGAGGLFRLRLGVKGVKENLSRIGL